MRRLAHKLLGPHDFDEVHVARTVLSRRAGVMVDVGAHHGGSLLDFAQDGWRVFAFEPDPNNRRVLLERTAGLTGVTVDDRAISAVDGDHVSFFTSDVSTGISSMAAFHPSHRPTTTVQTVRLDTFLAEHDNPPIDFLKTDTEGFDLPVLRTFPWDRRPRVVVCEFENRKTRSLGYLYDDLGRFLLDQGYAVFVSEWEPVVEYGRRHVWRDVRPYPAQLTDSGGWGNFIAVEPALRDRVMPAVTASARRLRLRRGVERLLSR